MSKDEIRLSAKYGVNPSVGVCWWCGEDDGTVILAGLLPRDKEAPHRAVWSKEPCPKCVERQATGITLIVASPAGSDPPKPTGQWYVITEDAARRFLSGDMLDATLRSRKAFIEPEVVAMLGLDQIEPVGEEL